MRWFVKDKWIRVFLILDIILLVVLFLASHYNQIIERFYSKKLFPNIISILSQISDSFSFSLSEITIWLLILFFLFLFVQSSYQLLKNRHRGKKSFKRMIKVLFITISCLFIGFYISWGFNYYRIPLKERIHIEKQNISKEDFLNTVNILIKLSNSLADEPQDKFTTINRSVEHGLASIFNKQLYSNTSKKRKHFFMNIILEKMLISGITIPYFNEIHLDANLLPEEVPFVLAHEKAHLHGITGEGEANFIAFISCMNSSNNFCRYSATVVGLRYFLSKLYRMDKALYKQAYKKLNPKTITVYKKIRERFQKNKGKLSNFQKILNNAYLKANGVKQGVKDYGNIVNYLIYYFKLNKQINLKY